METPIARSAAFEELSAYPLDGVILNIARYCRCLDNSGYAQHIKTKFCQLCETLMMHREELTFRSQLRLRNRLVDVLTDWVRIGPCGGTASDNMRALRSAVGATTAGGSNTATGFSTAALGMTSSASGSISMSSTMSEVSTSSTLAASSGADASLDGIGSGGATSPSGPSAAAPTAQHQLHGSSPPFARELDLTALRALAWLTQELPLQVTPFVAMYWYGPPASTVSRGGARVPCPNSRNAETS